MDDVKTKLLSAFPNAVKTIDDMLLAMRPRDQKPICNNVQSAILLRGPAGVGKITLSEHLAKLTGYDPLVFSMSAFQQKDAASRFITAFSGPCSSYPRKMFILEEMEDAPPQLITDILVPFLREGAPKESFHGVGFNLKRDAFVFVSDEDWAPPAELEVFFDGKTQIGMIAPHMLAEHLGMKMESLTRTIAEGGTTVHVDRKCLPLVLKKISRHGQGASDFRISEVFAKEVEAKVLDKVINDKHEQLDLTVEGANIVAHDAMPRIMREIMLDGTARQLKSYSRLTIKKQ